MTQNARVIKIIDQSRAEVVVKRISACGENCASCGGGCGDNKTARVIASNRISAGVGDEVVIKTKTSSILKAAFVVYILPIILFLAAYLTTASAGLADKYAIFISVAAFFAGIAVAMGYNKSIKTKNGFDFEISAFSK